MDSDQLVTSENSCSGSRVRIRKMIFLFLNQNICCGYSKESSPSRGSFEHPKNTLNLWVGKYLQFTLKIFLLGIYSVKKEGIEVWKN